MASPRKKASKSTTKAAPTGPKKKAAAPKTAPAAAPKAAPATAGKKRAAQVPAAPPKAEVKKAAPSKAKAVEATPKASAKGKSSSKIAGRTAPAAPAPAVTLKKADLAWLIETREALTSQRDKLLSLVQSTQAQMAGKSGSSVDVSDMASEGFEDELAVGLMAMESAQIEDIEAAIRRIDDGTYGICEACDKPIPRKRLQILPFARRCVACEGQTQRGYR